MALAPAGPLLLSCRQRLGSQCRPRPLEVLLIFASLWISLVVIVLLHLGAFFRFVAVAV